MINRIETTYADLRPTDLLVDKSGKAWPITDPAIPNGNNAGQRVMFGLLDPVTRQRTSHHLTKPATDSCTVDRALTHDETTAKLEAEMPGETVTHDQAVETVTTELDATVVAEVTAAEVDAADQATEVAPLEIVAFTDMTDLEMRSHLYLLHGVYGDDVTPRREVEAMHVKSHDDHESGRLKSRWVPHTHGKAAK